VLDLSYLTLEKMNGLEVLNLLEISGMIRVIHIHEGVIVMKKDGMTEENNGRC
jgi:hypothetical protein